MCVGEKRTLTASTPFTVRAVALSRYRARQDTIKGMAGKETTSQPPNPNPLQTKGRDDLTATITVRRDAETPSEIAVNIGSSAQRSPATATRDRSLQPGPSR